MSNQNDKKQTHNHHLPAPEEFKLMVDSIQDYAIFRLDLEGRVTSWNLGAERLTGYCASEIIGQHFSAFYTPEDIRQGQPEQSLERAKSEGRYEEEGPRLRKDGTQFWAHLSLAPLANEEQLRGFSAIVSDITERKKAEEIL